MTVSVLILAYNFENFINQTIDSALHQSVPADEIVVVDDCSTDRTPEILAAYGSAIRVIKTPTNSGVLGAEFYGIQHCKGDIVCVLGGDDIWLPQKIAAVKNAFEQDEKLMMVTHDFVYINKNAEHIRQGEPTLIELKKLKHSTDADGLDKAIRHSNLTWGGLVFYGNMSLRKSFLDEAGFEKLINSLENKKLTYDDTTLTTYLTLHTNGRFGFIDECLYKYRLHDNNISMSFADLAKMKVVLERGYWSHKATFDMVAAHPDLKSEKAYQSVLLKEKTYLLDLYNNRKIKAGTSFFNLISYFWRQKKIKKESLRFILITFFGPNFFHKIKGHS